jgi:hypothetical protein
MIGTASLHAYPHRSSPLRKGGGLVDAIRGWPVSTNGDTRVVWLIFWTLTRDVAFNGSLGNVDPEVAIVLLAVL